MDKPTKNIIWIISGAALLTLLFKYMSFEPIIKSFLPAWEGFSAKPYWDYKQWTWGYGTKVTGSTSDKNVKPTGTISREQAMKDALQEINRSYLYLKGLIKVPLNANQWAALLSFAYNLGSGNADNLVPNINGGKLSALESQWKAYHNAGGQPLQQLIDRRNAEWKLFTTKI